MRVTKASMLANDLHVTPRAGVASDTLGFMDLGPPSHGVEIRICGEDGTTLLHERQVGRFQIRGACVMQVRDAGFERSAPWPLHVLILPVCHSTLSGVLQPS